jgi:pilus assembly protein Flp/PilA
MSGLRLGQQLTTREELKMKDRFLKLSVKLQALMMQEEGQDLIEYALIVALVAFAATVGMNKLANGINLAFSNIAATLSADIP